MKKKSKVLFLIGAFLLNACATAPRSSTLGAAIGGAAGGLIGQSQSQNFQGTATGTAVGAGVGAIIGYLIHKDKETKEPKTESSRSEAEEFPALTKPKLRAIWVPDKIEGNKYIRGHYIYLIEDAGSWTKD